jgi:polyphosphate kinase 2
MMAKKKSRKKDKTAETTPTETTATKPEKMSGKAFDKELLKLQVELCHLQEWVKKEGLRVIVIFEGRDAAGKGGVIKRITERVSPRVFRVVALPAPSDREKTQLYAQRYMAHFPAAGEIIIFDRSWYNRAGVERVMGFCTDKQYERFLRVAPAFERDMVEQGIILIKYFFDVSQQEQERRFIARATDPLRHWKLSPMDVESWRRWWDYTAAFSRMLDATDTQWAPWHRVQANDKKRARLNCIAHLLSLIPYKKIPYTPPKAGKRHKPKPGTPKSLTFKHPVPEVY